MVSKHKNFRERGLLSEQGTVTDASLDLPTGGAPTVLAEMLFPVRRELPVERQAY